MTSTPRLMRTLMVGAVVLTLASAGAGCSWFKSKSKSNYTASKESQPLEVPPGLNLPDTSGATALPSVSSASASASGVVSRSGVASDITLAGDAATNFPRIGAALEGIEGVVINGRAEALGSFDVSYQGESFLIRVQDNAGASRLIALSPDGRILARGPAAALLAAIKAKL
jgi:uncharacterized lipoprotein